MYDNSACSYMIDALKPRIHLPFCEGRASSTDSTVRLWDLESRRSLRVLKGHSNKVWSVAWSPDGRRALSGSAENTWLWDLEFGRSLLVPEGHSYRVFSVAWSPDSRRALFGSM